MKSLLRPFFHALAKSGLVGPHGHNEIDLMLSGAKPLGTFWRQGSTDLTRLDRAAAEGRLIKGIFTRPVTDTYEFFAVPGSEKDAAYQQEIMFKRNWSPETVTEQDDEEYKFSMKRTSVFGTYMDVLDSAGNPITVQNLVQELLDGKSRAASFRDFIRGAYLCDRDRQHRDALPILDQAAVEGKLIHWKQSFTATDTFFIYGQPGQEENMKALADIVAHYNDPSRAEEQDCKTEARLLGYSESDIERYGHGYNRSSLKDLFLMHTQPIRRWARSELMKIDGPGWKRNL